MGRYRFDWRRLVAPRFWLQNYPTDWEWDATLNRLLDTHDPKPGYMTVSLGGVDVWVSNWPYSYGYPYTPRMDGLPSVATRKRLRAAIRRREREAFYSAIAEAEGRS